MRPGRLKLPSIVLTTRSTDTSGKSEIFPARSNKHNEYEVQIVENKFFYLDVNRTEYVKLTSTSLLNLLENIDFKSSRKLPSSAFNEQIPQPHHNKISEVNFQQPNAKLSHTTLMKEELPEKLSTIFKRSTRNVLEQN